VVLLVAVDVVLVVVLVVAVDVVLVVVVIVEVAFIVVPICKYANLFSNFLFKIK